MKTIRTLLPVLLAALLVGCGDDESTDPGLTGDAGAAQTMVERFVVPVIEAVNIARYSSLVPVPQATLPVPDDCQPLEMCESGSAEMCSDVSGIQFNLSDCVLHGTAIDGTITLQGDSFSGFTLLDITLNNNPILGRINYSQGVDCFTQTFVGVSVRAGNFTAVVNGELVFCDPPVTVDGVPIPSSGNLTFTLHSAMRAIEFWFYEGEMPGAWSLYVWDLAFTEQYLFCSGYLYDAFECGPPPIEE